jgi:signal transduction histidine kinase
MAMTAPISIQVRDEGVGRYDETVEAAVYFCCLEAVQNAVKHAGPGARVLIGLYTEGDRLHAEVNDDGPGFDTARAHDGVGLQNMRDRIGAVGGKIEISSSPGRGTIVRGTVPNRSEVSSEVLADGELDRRFIKRGGPRVGAADTVTVSSGSQTPADDTAVPRIPTGGRR